MQLIQANLYIGLSDAAFADDVAAVFRSGPDFVTLQEVDRRTTAQITPPGYSSYRSLASPWTAETPVVWRTDRWQEIDRGTEYLTTRRVRWGVRAVNWVTLRHRATGRVVSVISAHPAPTTRLTAGLLPVFADGLTRLSRRLERVGAVLVGGDLNVGYLSAQRAALPFSQAALRPTYDVLGRPAGGTGDKHSAVIDYILYDEQLARPVQQGTFALNSDHRAVWSNLQLDLPQRSGVPLRPTTP